MHGGGELLIERLELHPGHGHPLFNQAVLAVERFPGRATFARRRPARRQRRHALARFALAPECRDALAARRFERDDRRRQLDFQGLRVDQPLLDAGELRPA